MTTTIRLALLAVVLALAAPAIAQTEMIVQIEADLDATCPSPPAVDPGNGI